MEDEEDITLDEEGDEDEEEIDSDEDKTSKEKNDKDTKGGDDKTDKDKGKPKRSDIAQKIRYREKLRQSTTEVQRLKDELAELKSMVKKPTDDAEAKAQEYIRAQARTVFEELNRAQEREKEKVKTEFSDKLDEVLEENPDISEEELLDACEDYEVEPKTALKILKRQAEKKEKPKPKMPQPKHSSSESPKDKPDDSKKTMWQIAQEETRKFISKQ